MNTNLLAKLAVATAALSACEATMGAIEHARLPLRDYTMNTRWMMASQEHGNLLIEIRQLAEALS